jgi:uncharacterized protein YcaQ
MRELMEQGELLEVELPGVTLPYFTSPAMLEKLRSSKVNRQVQLLNPFDNLLIQRARVSTLFDFDYQIECYVPPTRRRYGYYCLPILYGSDLVGRLDPKAERGSQTLLIKHLELEKPVKPLDEFGALLAERLHALARANGCQQVVVEKSNDARLQKLLARHLAR